MRARGTVCLLALAGCGDGGGAPADAALAFDPPVDLVALAYVPHQLAADGTRVFWSYQESSGWPNTLYALEDGAPREVGGTEADDWLAGLEVAGDELVYMDNDLNGPEVGAVTIADGTLRQLYQGPYSGGGLSVRGGVATWADQEFAGQGTWIHRVALASAEPAQIVASDRAGVSATVPDGETTYWIEGGVWRSDGVVIEEVVRGPVAGALAIDDGRLFWVAEGEVRAAPLDDLDDVTVVDGAGDELGFGAGVVYVRSDRQLRAVIDDGATVVLAEDVRWIAGVPTGVYTVELDGDESVIRFHRRR